MIDIAFYGRRIFGVRLQSKSEKNVSRAWRALFDALSPPGDNSPEANRVAAAARIEKFNVLLETLAIAQGYDFDPVELKNNRYSPEAHLTLDAQNEALRSGLVAILAGERALKMEMTNVPPR
jgi:hypothetical protein